MLLRNWKRQTFKNQLLWTLSSIVLISAVSIFISSTMIAEYFLKDRAFDLLNSTNKISYTRIVDKLISNSAPSINFNEASEMLSDRTGLGLSGETYIMDSKGKLLTASRFTSGVLIAPVPDFKNKTEWIGIKHDYRDIPVLAHWRKIETSQFCGIIASEIDEDEVLRPIRKITYYSSLLTLLLILILFVFTKKISRLLSLNIDRENEAQSLKQSSMIEGQESERLRISYEIHDNIGQLLTAFSYKIASSKLPLDVTNSFTSQLRQINKSVREVIFNLSTAVLTTNGLKSSIEHIAKEMTQNSVSQTLFEFQTNLSDLDFHKIPGEKSLGIFRIIQEAFNNVAKHAKAEVATCHLDIQNSNLLLSIEDDGIGFNQESLQFKNSYGMLNIRVRVESMNGQLTLKTRPDQGTCWLITIPME